ncbi:MAG: hypothetical protein AAB581_01020 [Patescibacteria group bacterium]
MDIKEHTQPDKLERYSFLWSEARLAIAALALFLGGIPPVFYFLPFLYGITSPLLHLAWVISGVASVYMLYRWNTNGRMLFGGKEPRDLYAFFVSVVSGINLGLTGLLGQNIGMSISSSKVIFLIVGVVYIVAAYHLWKRWKASGEKMF